MSQGTIDEKLTGGVCLLTLNRSEKKNALNHAMWGELLGAMRRARISDEVHVVVVTGAGGNFSAGTDLGEMNGSAPEGPAAQERHPSYLLMDLLCEFDKPLIAAVDGAGVGFGLTLLLHCDFVYVTPGARLRAPFVRLGVVPEAASTYLLPLIAGYRNAADIVFGAEFISGSRAVELGVADECLPPEQLLKAALDRARRLAAQPSRALQYTKRLLIEGRREQLLAARRREDAAFDELMGKPENREALRAFFEQRAPDLPKAPAE